jgi:hypothetical protein
VGRETVAHCAGVAIEMHAFVLQDETLKNENYCSSHLLKVLKEATLLTLVAWRAYMIASPLPNSIL